MNRGTLAPASRHAAVATVALHALVVALLLSYQPARQAIFEAAPIMVELLTTQPPELKTQPPKPRPVEKAPNADVPRPVELPQPATVEPSQVVTVTGSASSPFTAPVPHQAAPSQPVAEASPPSPVIAVTPPIFNADYLDNPSPHYPAAARRLGEQGRVTLRVLVTPAGRAEEVQLRTSSGFARLDDSARETVRAWKFVPARRGSEAISAWVLIPINFRMER